MGIKPKRFKDFKNNFAEGAHSALCKSNETKEQKQHKVQVSGYIIY